MTINEFPNISDFNQFHPWQFANIPLLQNLALPDQPKPQSRDPHREKSRGPQQTWRQTVVVSLIFWFGSCLNEKLWIWLRDSYERQMPHEKNDVCIKAQVKREGIFGSKICKARLQTTHVESAHVQESCRSPQTPRRLKRTEKLK